MASLLNDSGSHHKLASSSSSMSSDLSFAQRNVDLLFERDMDAASWEPAKPPEVLGEFLDSRHMLPLLLPSDPRMLSAAPKKPAFWTDAPASGAERSTSRASRRSAGTMPWRTSTRRMRDFGLEMLRWVDGVGAVSRWTRPLPPDDPPPYDDDDELDDERALGHQADVTITADTSGDTPWQSSLTAKPAARKRMSMQPTMSPKPLLAALAD
jgi:hypothetical protein